jgi:hypothetical protein
LFSLNIIHSLSQNKSFVSVLNVHLAQNDYGDSTGRL